MDTTETGAGQAGRQRHKAGYGDILKVMRSRKSVFCTVLFFLPAWGNASSGLTLADVENGVRQHNPAVLAAQARARSARDMASAAAAWPSPGLGVTREDFPRPGFALDQSARKSIIVSQEVPFPGKTYLAWRTFSAEAEKMDAEARMVFQEQLFMARQAYWDLVVATQAAGHYERASEVMAGVVTLSGKRNQFGQAGRMEQLMDPMARMEKASLDIRRLELGQERNEAEATLAGLMGLEAGKNIEALYSPSVPENQGTSDSVWMDSEMADSPSVRVALQGLKIMQARRAQARAGWLPDIMLEYAAVDMKDGEKMGMASAKLTLPFVWFWKPLEENRAATEEVQASQADLEKMRLEARRLAHVELSRLAAARQQEKIYSDEVLPQAARALDLAVSGYQSGSIGPADALTAVRSWLSMNLEKTMLSAQIGRSMAVLSRLRGS